MKTKYYLRGLATGLVIAAVLMSFVSGQSKSISDEEIRERAARLGMVMQGGNTTLADSERTKQQEELGTSGEIEGTGENGEPGTTGDDEGTGENGEPGTTGDAEETGESEEPGTTGEAGGTGENEEPGTEGTGENGEPETSVEPQGGEHKEPQAGGEINGAVTVTIYSGTGSGEVARVLKRAGLVENAEDFDEFLCANGYDKRICVDVYRIPVGSSYEEIARIITKRG